MSDNRHGQYQTACEASPNRRQIDIWLNEGKSNLWISQELKNLDESISDKSIGKYRKYRGEFTQTQLEKNPVYQDQINVMQDTLVQKVSEIKHVDVMAHLSNMIEHNAQLLADAQINEIEIRSVKDITMVQQTMLSAIKEYGDTVLKVQKLQKIEEDPTLIRPTMNVNVKNVLVDILKGVNDDATRSGIIDRLRAGIGQYESGRLSTNIEPDRPSYVGGDEQDFEG